MSHFSYSSKTDKNQPNIVRQLRAFGYRVDVVSRLKKLYDLVVTGTDIRGEVRTVRVEVKTEGGKLTYDEQEYWDAEPYPETLIIAYTSNDVLKWFGKV